MSALREIREARRLTGAELGRRAGVTSGRVYRWEVGDWPDAWRTLARLADVLGVSIDQVLGREPPPAPPTDALAQADRELLDAMAHDAERLLGSQVLRLVGGWRGIARAAWLGQLYGMRDHGELTRTPDPQAVRAVEERATQQRRIAAAKAKP